MKQKLQNIIYFLALLMGLIVFNVFELERTPRFVLAGILAFMGLILNIRIYQLSSPEERRKRFIRFLIPFLLCCGIIIYAYYFYIRELR